MAKEICGESLDIDNAKTWWKIKGYDCGDFKKYIWRKKGSNFKPRREYANSHEIIIDGKDITIVFTNGMSRNIRSPKPIKCTINEESNYRYAKCQTIDMW